MRYVIFSIALALVAGLSTCVAPVHESAGHSEVDVCFGQFDDTQFSRDGRASYRLDSDSRVKLSGGATIGSWDAVSDELGGTFAPGVGPHQVRDVIVAIIDAEADERPIADDDLAVRPATEPSVRFEIPVTSLRSGNRRMERDMHEALKADEHPLIVYTFEGVVDADWFLRDADVPVGFELVVEGDLLLAGVTKRIAMPVRIEPQPGGRLHVVASEQFDMEEFNIDPPTAMFGLIKADETVDVSFELFVEPAADRNAGEDGHSEARRDDAGGW